MASQDFIDPHDYEQEEDGQILDFFVIEIAMPVWNRMNAKKRIALVDHELSHCFVNDEGKYSLIPHDIEEFDGVVHRNGIYRDDVQRFVDVASRQMPLPMETEGPAAGAFRKHLESMKGNGKDKKPAAAKAKKPRNGRARRPQPSR